MFSPHESQAQYTFHGRLRARIRALNGMFQTMTVNPALLDPLPPLEPIKKNSFAHYRHSCRG
jgi:hypothetical protein